MIFFRNASRDQTLFRAMMSVKENYNGKQSVSEKLSSQVELHRIVPLPRSIKHGWCPQNLRTNINLHPSRIGDV